MTTGSKWLISSIILFQLLCISVCGVAAPSGHETKCGDEKTETKTKTEPIDEFRQDALKLVDDLASKAKEAANSADIDVSHIRDWLESLDLGWGGDRIAEAAADLAEKAAKALEEKVKSFVESAVDLAESKVEEAIKDLGPNIKFQADLKWKENCCDKAQWSGGAANPVGKVGFGASLTFGFEVAAGAAAGVAATIPLKIEITVKGAWKVVRCNPVRPTEGSGSSLTITATPLWESTVEGSVTTQAGIKVAIGTSITNSDTLKDVKGTLKCP